MKYKYFFPAEPGPELCYPKSHFIEEMKESGITEINVHPAVMMKGEPFAWCRLYCECIETRERTCGRWCKGYKPRNGKNGRCRHSANCYEPLEETVILD